MENTTETISAIPKESEEDNRYCWVCFATDEEDELMAWVKPCHCIGTTRWVHQTCIQRWVDEKQKGNSFKRVACPQCLIDYIIVLPSMGIFANVLEGLDMLIRKGSPFIAAGCLVGTFYWSAVTYGAITVLQVVGQTEGLILLENTDHIFLMMTLPAIPVCLVLGRMIRWEDMILRYIQNRQRKNLPLLGLILPIPEDDNPNHYESNQVSGRTNMSDSLSTTRVLCGALLLPSISSLVGKIFFDSIKNNLHRTLVGGLAFVVVKGVFKIYFKHKQYIRKKQRKILDYTDDNIKRYVMFNRQFSAYQHPPNFYHEQR